MLATMSGPYHKPVLLHESVEGLQINPGGIYVDLTFGGGGHSALILEKLTTGKLFAFDQDPDARANAAAFSKDNRFVFIESNFRFLQRYLKMYGVTQVDGILADLGISSHQIDAGHRGFSTRFDALLDMRMSQQGDKSAHRVLNEYSVSELQEVFGQYGEVRNAKTLANAIVSKRSEKEIETTHQLKAIAASLAPRGREMKYYAQIFQALRIEVNDEMAALKEMLLQTVDLLKKDGRLVIISYHSLEDRPVKNIMRYGNFEGIPNKDFFGNLVRPLEPVVRKPIVPGMEEITKNKRARSAKLRICKKI